MKEETKQPDLKVELAKPLHEALNLPEQTLKDLVANPGYRARFFDKNKIEFGTQALEHLDNAKKQLEAIKPPLTPDSVKNVYDLFNKLNNDLTESSGDKPAPIDILMKDLEKLEPIPTSEQLKQIKSDILTAYRFKVITAAGYIDEKTLNERQKDFLQLISKHSKNFDDSNDCYKKIFDDLCKDVTQDTKSSLTMPGDDNSRLDDLVSTLLSKKHLVYLGPEVTLATVKAAFSEEGKEELFNQFKEKFEAVGKLENEVKELFNNNKSYSEDMLNAIYNNENFKKLGMENGTQQLMNQILAMPAEITIKNESDEEKKVDNSLRTQFLEELPKQPLREFLDKQFDELKTASPGDINDRAKAIIKSIPNNNHYTRLNGVGNTSAAKILFERINSVKNPEHKTALTNAIYAVAEEKINRRLKDNSNPVDTLNTIRDDHLCAVLDKDEINKRIAKQILSLPKTQQTRIQPLLDELNKQTGENFTIPKSGFEVFKEKAGNWFKSVGNAIGSAIKAIGSTIGSAFQSIGNKGAGQIDSTATKQEDEKQKDTNQNPDIEWKNTSLTPQQARLFLIGNGKLRSNDEVIKMLQQSAYQQLIDNPSGKSAAAVQHLEQILRDFDAVYAKVQKECMGNPQEFGRYTKEILDTTLVLERRKNQLDPTVKDVDEEKRNIQEVNLHNKSSSTAPNKPLPPLPTRTTEEEKSNRPNI